jgi:hypothetical protein
VSKIPEAKIFGNPLAILLTLLSRIEFLKKQERKSKAILKSVLYNEYNIPIIACKDSNFENKEWKI